MAANLLVEIVSPEGAAFQGEATRFRAPGVEGSFEVLRGHAPLVAATGIGQVYVTLPSGERLTFATSAGHVEVLNDHVIMLAETVEAAGDLDPEVLRAAEAEARDRIAASQSPEEREAAKAELELARNRLRTSMGKV